VKDGRTVKYRPQPLHHGTTPSNTVSAHSATPHLNGLSLMLTGGSAARPPLKVFHKLSFMKDFDCLIKSFGNVITCEVGCFETTNLLINLSNVT